MAPSPRARKLGQAGANVEESVLDEGLHARARGGYGVEEPAILDALHRIGEEIDLSFGVAQRETHDLDEKIVALRRMERHHSPGAAGLRCHRAPRSLGL